MPPLRERKDDLPLLVEHILEEYHRKHTQFENELSSEALVGQTMLPVDLTQALYLYDWPGNVRELQNLLQRYLATRDLPAILSLLGSSGRAPSMPATVSVRKGLLLRDAVQAFEKQMIADTLKCTRYHIGHAAELLGLPRITLHRKIKKYQLKTKA